MQVGTTNLQELLQAMPDTETGSKIDDFYFNIEFSHNGKIVKFLTNSLMALDRDDNGYINIYQLVDQLERIDRFKTPLLYVINDLNKSLEDSETSFDRWYAVSSEESKTKIIKERMRLKDEEKIPASMFTGITKEDIKNDILKNGESFSIYSKYQEKISDTKDKIRLIEGLRYDLDKRSITLQKLLDKHKQDVFVKVKEPSNE